MKSQQSDFNNQEHLNSQWYAIYTKPRAEKKVFERLVSVGFTAYLPLVESIREWSDRKKKISIPLISSFVFVKTTPDEVFNTLKVQGTNGVLRYLGKPAIVREVEIENLKILMNDTSQLVSVHEQQIEKGEYVEVINGPFAGLTGQSVHINGKHRLVVEIDSLASKLVVNVPLAFVKKSCRAN